MSAFFPNSASTEAFAIGDPVRWYITERAISPYIGRVVAKNPHTVKIYVTWPVGDTTQHNPEELIFVPPEQGRSPVQERAGYDSWEILKSEQVFGKLTPASPADLQKTASGIAGKMKVVAMAKDDARTLQSSGLTDLQTYHNLYAKHAGAIGDEAVRSVVASVYTTSK
jgi:hypothetical protein